MLSSRLQAHRRFDADAPIPAPRNHHVTDLAEGRKRIVLGDAKLLDGSVPHLELERVDSSERGLAIVSESRRKRRDVSTGVGLGAHRADGLVWMEIDRLRFRAAFGS